MPSGLFQWLLVLLGIGFLGANLLLFVDFVRYHRRRKGALLTWPGARPKYFGLLVAIGVTLGLLIVVKVAFQLRSARQLFGESMMFVYYGALVPLSRRIGRGFYEDGIWSESGFMPYWQIAGITWREGPEILLILISRHRNLARRLVVPAAHYAAARRLLRDKIAAHDIDFTGTGLDLGLHDERDDV
jgi:hypothetical protein